MDFEVIGWALGKGLGGIIYYESLDAGWCIVLQIILMDRGVDLEIAFITIYEIDTQFGILKNQNFTG